MPDVNIFERKETQNQGYISSLQNQQNPMTSSSVHHQNSVAALSKHMLHAAAIAFAYKQNLSYAFLQTFTKVYAKPTMKLLKV